MFGKWMNNYYYGKSGKGDYRKEDLPTTRKQLFWEMLRVRLAGLFRLNLIAVVAFLPLMYVLAMLVSQVYSLMAIVHETQQDLAAASPEYLAIYNNLGEAWYGLLFRTALLLIPAIAITGPLQAGMAYITRNWARDEHAFVWSDFKDAVRNNWQQALGVSVITGLVPIVMLVCWRFYSVMVAGNAFFIVPQMLTMVLGVVWMLALVYMYPMLVTYRMKFFTVLRNSLLLAVGRLPHTVGVRLLTLVPAAIALVLMFFTPYGMYALMALAAYYILLGNALARFVYASFTNAAFDKYINTRLEGAPVNKGLARAQEWEDDEPQPDKPATDQVPEGQPPRP